MREYILTDAERIALKRFFATGERSGELRVLESRIRENLSSGRLPDDYQFIQKWVHAYCKGRIASYVARGKEPAKQVVKTMLTMIQKKALLPTDIELVLNEVERNSVNPFSADKQEFAERRERLDGLRRLLATE
jgi:hypothetical protein